jgi:hypothetical protein
MTLRIVALFLFMGLLSSCENQDWEFDDYKYQLVYFPYQTPARTLLLGNYDQGLNENDNNHSFEIGVVLSGVYENKVDRKVHFAIDKSLLDTVANVMALPAKYYTLETISPVTIPAGSVNGRIKVKLRDAFFEDSLAFGLEETTNYVIPIVLTGVENVDSIASGKAAVANPVRVISSDWEVAPLDYTLYGIKFKNKFDGRYLRRGVDILGDGAVNLDTSVYHAKYIEWDEIVRVTTKGSKQVELQQPIRRGQAGTAGSITLKLLFDDNGVCSVSGLGVNPYNVSGTGKFVEGGDSFGGKPRDVIYLDYQYVDFNQNGETHAIKDTLVLRDRNAMHEVYPLVIK